MLSVFIGDDERLVRQGLKKIIPWSDMGLEIVGEAADGYRALSDIMAIKPDILLLDIRMPKMHGLEITKRLRQANYKGHIIILSGYSEFDYAREAIGYNVDSYLTKPIDEKVLAETLMNIIDSIKKEHLHERHIKYYRQHAKNQILKEMLQHTMNIPSLMGSVEELNLEADDYQVVIIDPFKISSEKAIQEFCRYLHIPNQSKSIEHIFVHDMDILILKGEFMHRRLMEFMAMDITPSFFLAIGRPVNTLNHLYYSYDGALAVYEHRFFLEEGTFFMIDEQLPSPSSMTKSLEDISSDAWSHMFQEDLLNASPQKFKKHIKALKDYMHQVKNNVHDIKRYLYRLFVGLQSLCHKEGIAFLVPFEDHNQFLEWVEGQEKLQDLLEEIERLGLCFMESSRPETNQTILKSFITYVNSHYMYELKLKTLAPKFGYNSAYLGKLINDYLGETFNDYLHEIRVEKAKTLLLEKENKVYEIAKKVGYKNVDYFYLKFKTYVGETPLEYRHHQCLDSPQSVDA